MHMILLIVFNNLDSCIFVYIFYYKHDNLVILKNKINKVAIL
jgi:hypothetical protein